MGEFFGSVIIIYLLLCAAIVPVVLLDSYSHKRDCEIKFDVGQCQWKMLPLEKDIK